MAICAHCGFLAIRNTNTEQLGEVNRTYEGNPFFNLESHGNLPLIVGNTPLCFARKYNLHNEYFSTLSKTLEEKGTNEGNNLDLHLSVQKVLNTERECDCFTQWQTGFTPKEIQDALDRKWMQKREDERRDADRKWQLEREDADRKWRNKQDWKLVFVAGGFTLLGAILVWLLTLSTH